MEQLSKVNQPTISLSDPDSRVQLVILLFPVVVVFCAKKSLSNIGL